MHWVWNFNFFDDWNFNLLVDWEFFSVVMMDRMDFVRHLNLYGVMMTGMTQNINNHTLN
jgi:hypothetical protein